MGQIVIAKRFVVAVASSKTPTSPQVEVSKRPKVNSKYESTNALKQTPRDPVLYERHSSKRSTNFQTSANELYSGTGAARTTFGSRQSVRTPIDSRFS